MSDTNAAAACQCLMAVVLRLGSDPAAAIGALERAKDAVAGHEPELRRGIAYEEALLRLQLGARFEEAGAVDQAQHEYRRAHAVLPPLESVAATAWSADWAWQVETHARVAQSLVLPDEWRRAVVMLAACARSRRIPRALGIAWQAMAQWQRHRGRSKAALAAVRLAVKHLSSAPHDPRLLEAQRALAQALEADGDLQGAYAAHVRAARTEVDQRRYVVAQRAELLMLDQEAEQELRRSEQTLAYAQRLSGVGHMVASINHELNQPMASIRMLAETALALVEEGDDVECAASITAMHRISRRLVDTASKLAAFPAQAATPPQPVSLRAVAHEALVTLASRLAQTPCRLDADLPDVTVMAQEGQLVRVIVNLLNNALDACDDIDSPRIAFRCARRSGHMVLSVRDNGPGLSESARARLFQPFFSTKPAGRGLGLGLAMSRQVMREMGGDLTGHDAEGGGAEFDIILRCETSETAD
jgi:signal transduction histidine kinase